MWVVSMGYVYGCADGCGTDVNVCVGVSIGVVQMCVGRVSVGGGGRPRVLRGQVSVVVLGLLQFVAEVFASGQELPAHEDPHAALLVATR